MALSMRLASAWPSSSRLPLKATGSRRLDHELGAALLGHRLVEVGDVLHDLARIEFGHGAVGRAGLDARDHQQRVERLDELVGLLDRRLQRRAVLVGVGRAGQRRPRRDSLGASAAS